jgi:hypothetical protein
MPSSSDSPLLSNWSPYVSDVYTLHQEFLRSDCTDTAWHARWNDHREELADLSAGVSEAIRLLRGDMTCLTEGAGIRLCRKVERETVKEVRRRFVPIWQRYRELRQLVEAYSSACALLGTTPDDHLDLLWSSPEFARYEVVRKWLDARKPRRKAAARARYLSLVSNPAEKAAPTIHVIGPVDDGHVCRVPWYRGAQSASLELNVASRVCDAGKQTKTREYESFKGSVSREEHRLNLHDPWMLRAHATE